MIINHFLKNKRVLVTGGSGFIGSNLCEYLLSSNAIVKCLDNFSTGHIKNIKPFLNNKNFTLVEGDICDLQTCQDACKDSDYVLHQAALGSVPRSIDDPISTNNVNVNGFVNMLIASRDQKIKRFVYASSSAVYGDSPHLPKFENVIGNPLSPYAITKYINELYAINFSKLYSLETVGLRYFNVFGKKQDPNGPYAAVIPKFIKIISKHESPIINGDKYFSRDFTHIDNVIQMNIISMLTENKKAVNEIYNTAYGEKITLIELFDSLKKCLIPFDKTISNLNYKLGPFRDGDIPHSLANIDKAKMLLSYKPIKSFQKGLKDYVKWYYNNL